MSRRKKLVPDNDDDDAEIVDVKKEDVPQDAGEMAYICHSLAYLFVMMFTVNLMLVI